MLLSTCSETGPHPTPLLSPLTSPYLSVVTNSFTKELQFPDSIHALNTFIFLGYQKLCLRPKFVLNRLDGQGGAMCVRSMKPQPPTRCRANVAHVRQSRPDSGLGFQVKVLNTLQGVPFSLGSGQPQNLLPLLLYSHYRSKKVLER